MTARVESVEFTTSLFPREGVYLVPVNVAVQRAAEVGVGDRVHVELHLDVRD